MATIALTPYAATAAAPLRLTRRGRLLLAVAALLVLTGLLLSVGLVRAGSAVAGDGAPATATVVVGAGETLWAIADRVDPERDPRAVIADIVALNDLSGHVVLPGQSLVVPAVAPR